MTVRRLAVAALMGALFWGLPAAAQDRSGDDVAATRAAARPLARRAYERFEREDYAAAIELFRKAESHYHAPPHLLYLARAQVQLDQLVEARDTYLAVATEKLEHYAPDPFHKAQAAARAELAQLREQIPRVSIQVTGAPPADVKLWIDDQSVSEVLPVHELNPGPHRVRAEAPGQGPISREIVLAEGNHEQLAFPFQPAGEPAANTLLVPALVSFGLGAVGLAVGVGAGVASLNRVSDIKDQCIDGHCPPDTEPDADHAMMLGNLSTVGVVVAALGAATGATLLIIGMGSDSEPSEVAVRARLSFGSAQLELAF